MAAGCLAFMRPLMRTLQDPIVLRHTLANALLFSSLFPLLRGYLYNTQMSRKITQKNMNNTIFIKYSVINRGNLAFQDRKKPDQRRCLRVFSLYFVANSCPFDYFTKPSCIECRFCWCLCWKCSKSVLPRMHKFQDVVLEAVTHSPDNFYKTVRNTPVH